MITKGGRLIKGVSDDLMTSGIRVNRCCVKNCCLGNEKKGGKRPWCLVGKKAVKDVLCKKMDKCFNEFPLKLIKDKKSKKN